MESPCKTVQFLWGVDGPLPAGFDYFVQPWEACNSLHRNEMRRPQRSQVEHIERLSQESTKELSMVTIDFTYEKHLQAVNRGMNLAALGSYRANKGLGKME
jgi:hypothetical protein